MNVDLQVYSPMILPHFREKTGVGSWPPTRHWSARGELSIRHYEQCLFERAEDAKAFIEEGYRTGQRGDHFTVGPMKLIQDGSLGARTAAMNEPYEDSPENTGIITFSQDELDDLFAFFVPASDAGGGTLYRRSCHGYGH